MPKKQSGLGRGLGDLLDDNTPAARSGKGVIINNGGEQIVMSPAAPNSYINVDRPRNDLPRNRSIKANFKK